MDNINTLRDGLPMRDLNDDPLDHSVGWEDEDDDVFTTRNPNRRPLTPQARAALKALHAEVEREWNTGTIGRNIED